MGIKVQALRVTETGIGHIGWRCRPVGCEKSSECCAVVSSSEVVVAGFGIVFFAGEMLFGCVCPASTVQEIAERVAVAVLFLIAVGVGLNALRPQPVGQLEVISGAALARSGIGGQ